MERTDVLNVGGDVGGGVLATRETVRLSGWKVPHGSSARDRLEAVCEALRAVSLEGLDEEGLRGVAAGVGQVIALADALTLRTASGLEALRAGSAREALVAGAKLSGRAAKRVTEAARQVEEMPNVGRMLEAGDLTLESVFALGAAARQCGAAVVDGSEELLYQAAARDAGSFNRVARRFAQRHDPSAGGDLLKGQRNSRKADLFVGSDGMGVLHGEMDPMSFGLLEQAVDERKDYLWRRDGGRDGTPDAVRNNGQRSMDAIFELCTGRNALTHEPLPADDGPRGSRRLPTGRIIAVTAGVVDGTDTDGSCEIIGVGPVPPSVLDSISPDDRLVGAIFGGDGRPLWLGRMERLANIDQYVAVALRDRGCVLCRAPMHRCDIHHADEFCADGGLTDIENLVALCCGCHLWVHRTNRRVVRQFDAHGIITWSTAPRGSDPGGREGRDPSAAGLADGFSGRGDHTRGDALGISKTEVGAGFAGRDPPAAGQR
ncbi:DUF222 domain-containing protein [Candidatus Poriferisodalis sp.]|uniref:HNH endonuclease signature motif containing protein n=1 Tax=Candidatus Poriferisodalis sp. TaxID=3101277 RepID=UPI003D0BCF43